jgi:hypothetical protein
MKNGERRAFPADEHTHTDGGLTKREYFAAMAMQVTMISSYSVNTIAEIAVKIAVKMADALLAELEKTKQKEL